MYNKRDFIASIVLAIVVGLLLSTLANTERYYVSYNTYVRNDAGEMVEQDEFKHLTIDAKSLNDAKEQIFEIENQLYADVIVDSVAIQSHVIVKGY